LQKTVYEHSRLYDLAFSYRDFKNEVSVFEDWFEKFSKKSIKLNRVLELAAGPARHAIEFAHRGKSATALDYSSAMCRYAKLVAKEEGARIDVVEADMVSFRIKNEFELVINAIDSLSHITKVSDLVRHFRTVARHTVDGGIYIVEVSKLEDHKSNTKSEWNIKANGEDLHVKWDSGSPAAGSSQASTSMNRKSKPINSKASKTSLVTIEITDRTKNVSISDSMRLRAWTKTEIDNAIARSEKFRVKAIFGAFDSNVKWSSKEAWRLIYVLQKRDDR
jgi:SAM-dependent methyltransferase